MEIRRSGNFGIIDTGTDKGLISFSIGGRGKGWEPSSIQLNRRGAFFSRKISVNGTFIVPMGDNNDMRARSCVYWINSTPVKVLWVK